MHALGDSGGVLTSLLGGRVASELMMAKTVLLPSYMRVDVRQNAIDTAHIAYSSVVSGMSKSEEYFGLCDVWV